MLTVCRAQSAPTVTHHGGRSGRGGIHYTRPAAARRMAVLSRVDGPYPPFYAGKR
jgi:hypothetical protein